MSQDEQAKLNETEEQEDVEAHRRHLLASDEGAQTEGESDDDFEAHRHSLKAKHRSV